MNRGIHTDTVAYCNVKQSKWTWSTAYRDTRIETRDVSPHKTIGRQCKIKEWALRLQPRGLDQLGAS